MTSESFAVDDFIVLGRGCPERVKNGRVTVCVAGYSGKHGFMRVYPTRVGMPLRQWSIVKVPLERNPQDTRKESWKIQGSKGEWQKLDEKIQVIGELERQHRINLIANLADKCANVLNEEKRSLGIVKPIIEKCYLSEQADFDTSIQLTLLGIPQPKVKEQYPFIPRIKYRCSGCMARVSHDQQVLEWGFYEWIRKNPNKADEVWQNALIFSPKHEIFFLVGNMFRYRNIFLIVSVLRLPKGPVFKPLANLTKA
ncbi:MAG: hypothetical protein OEY22_10690 [Candidatus Bathyarchaeota archaeon]|nr:hypothetical protein [Candidatus Bathyarchaeota archaeon]MDH5788779.1 hypothetical protein [Candidatus Bathyarchaeota archaeon]